MTNEETAAHWSDTLPLLFPDLTWDGQRAVYWGPIGRSVPLAERTCVMPIQRNTPDQVYLKSSHQQNVCPTHTTFAPSLLSIWGLQH